MGDEVVLQLDERGVRYVDPTGERLAVTSQKSPLGRQWATVPHKPDMRFNDAITVEVWLHARRATSDGLQALVSKWAPGGSFGNFAAYDAGVSSGLDSTGFLGAVFDGRYVYFVPQHDRSRRHGKVLRYDTHKPLQDPGAYVCYDAERTSGLDTRGYYGACFDGRHIYFVPRHDGQNHHSRVLRYDTTGEFTRESSWDAHDAQQDVSHQGVAFDGHYIYFAPGYKQSGGDSGTVLRYDTHGGFHNRASWTTYDASNTSGLNTANFDGGAFDGRYVYFIPLNADAVLRYDSKGPFDDQESWTAYNVTQLGVNQCVGSVFDGQYLYLVPYGRTRVVVRYDTRAEFNNAKSWESYDAAGTDALYTIGYDGGIFDGRYVTFIPFWDDSEKRWHTNFLRYDSQKSFGDPRAWSAMNASHIDGINTIGYNGGAFDGRYLYCAPWHDFTDYPQRIIGHGRVLRYDTLGDKGSFSLRWSDYGHNGGLNAAVPGPSFVINTDGGARSVSAHRTIPPGRHHLAGVYDRKSIKLYVDGKLVAERQAMGTIVDSDVDLAIGRINGGLGYFDGTIHRVRISNEAKPAEMIKSAYNEPTN